MKVNITDRTCKVYAVDYGENETVSFDKLRKLPKNLKPECRNFPECLEPVFPCELNGDRLDNATVHHIWGMMEKENRFRGNLRVRSIVTVV